MGDELTFHPVEYREEIPRAPVATIVDRFWTMRLPAIDAPAPVSRVLPDGACDLIFDVSGRTAPFLSAPTDRPFIHVADRPFDFFGVRLHPGALPAFTSIPALELRNTDGVTLNQAMGPTAAEWAERIAAAKSLSERVHIAESTLSPFAARRDRCDNRIHAALRQAPKSDGDGAIRISARAVGLSVRQLERIYLGQVGLAPSETKRILQVLSAARRLDRRTPAGRVSREESLTRIGLDAGFYDQAHFTRTFRRHTGLTPGAFRRERAQFRD